MAVRRCAGRTSAGTTSAFIRVALTLLVLLSASHALAADQSYQSYIFDQWGNPVPTPISYVPVDVVRGEELGIGKFDGPQDLFISHDGSIYIADSRNNRIVQLARDFSLIREITGFEAEDGPHRLNNPACVFVDRSGSMFIGDQGNQRVVQLDPGGCLKQIIKYTKPEGTAVEIVEFLPARIVVDPVGRIFVAARNVFEGLMEFNADGEFTGFVGAPLVRPSLYDLFWYRFATKEQRERRALFLPIEYTSVALDDSGFIYAVAKDEVRRLNPTGLDVLNRQGLWPVVGDIGLPVDTNPSFLTDITVDGYGIYHVLDSERGRVFAYDDSGNLLYTFGAFGPYTGAFNRPRAIDGDGVNLYVLDEQRGEITVFAPTEYATLIHLANKHYMLGDFEASTEVWYEVLKHNNHLPLAYNGLGMAFLRQRDYTTAMRYLRLGNNRTQYSKAFAKYRKEVIEQNFLWIMIAAICLVALIIVWYKRSSRRLEERRVHDFTSVRGWRRIAGGLQYALHVIVNPVDGFWDLRYEERGNLPAAMIILIAASLSLVFLKQYTGYLFNPRDVSQINVFGEVGTTLATFFLWCAINWALTTLMEGKGSFSDIVMATAYALTPLVLINIPIAVLSNFMTIEEGSYYYFFQTLSVLWCGILIFFATMITHHYSLGKTAGTCVLNVVGMGVVVFLGLLFFNMVSMLTEYVVTVYREVVFRL
jgi:DNA-binding beta-propeller fold protein YncE